MRILIQFEKNPLLFVKPQAMVRCDDPSRLEEAFKEVERLLNRGFYLAGFVSYEAGYSFEERLLEKKRYGFPLLLMGAYEKPLPHSLRPGRSINFSLDELRLNLSRTQYASHIDRIRAYIAAGDVYQITYCIKLHFGFRGDPLALYTRLLREQPVPYPAYLEADDFHILSLSPERFVKKKGKRVVTEPMKGTWPRGETFLSDVLARYRLWGDAKNRAENVMIADLLRNDLGRVGRKIATPRLFTVTPYATLHQMTSTVTGEVDRDIPVRALFRALFPSGSVTGAPKVRAMEIIRELEQEERKIYTGAIGYITPDRDLYFNVPIRTILLSGGHGEMGIGGGIVWDSTPEGEWAEGLLKARFLTKLARDQAQLLF